MVLRAASCAYDTAAASIARQCATRDAWSVFRGQGHTVTSHLRWILPCVLVAVSRCSDVKLWYWPQTVAEPSSRGFSTGSYPLSYPLRRAKSATSAAVNIAENITRGFTSAVSKSELVPDRLFGVAATAEPSKKAVLAHETVALSAGSSSDMSLFLAVKTRPPSLLTISRCSRAGIQARNGKRDS